MVFTRSIFVGLVFFSVASAQFLDNSLQLDPEGTFRLDWSVDYSLNASNPTVIFETHVKTRGELKFCKQIKIYVCGFGSTCLDLIKVNIKN